MAVGGNNRVLTARVARGVYVCRRAVSCVRAWACVRGGRRQKGGVVLGDALYECLCCANSCTRTF